MTVSLDTMNSTERFDAFATDLALASYTGAQCAVVAPSTHLISCCAMQGLGVRSTTVKVVDMHVPIFSNSDSRLSSVDSAPSRQTSRLRHTRAGSALWSTPNR